MTLTCPDCGTIDIELTNDNGAEYPQTRVEFYECRHCDNLFTTTLGARGDV